MIKRIIYVIISVAFIGVISCSEGSTEPDAEEENGFGKVELQITGDYERQKTGTAMFWGAGESSFANDTGNTWQLDMSDSEFPNPGVQTFRLDFIFMDLDEHVSRPGPGTYPIGESVFAEGPDSPVYTAVLVRTQDMISYSSSRAVLCGISDEYSHTGVLIIENSGPELVTGSFEFEGYFCQDGATQAVTISGEFTAPRADLVD